MIEVTRLNDTKLAVNPYQIEMIEETPDTVILFTSGRKIVVKEKAKDLNDLFVGFLSDAIRKGIELSKK